MVDNPLPIIILIVSLSFLFQITLDKYAKLHRTQRIYMRKKNKTLLFMSNPCFNGYIGKKSKEGT